ncbi:hypothetical protein VHEMI09903 [[Torrubiella] hemipterigena]|uniref:Acyl-CoA thioesterase II n=1 Tax=[Torrubiella] hemipterigena TaxID=1531966 RepID=A0A0A1TBC8_9HYPO|nr:hypothetical protein VHEMI09903 [[Torrubiella] hemipterigena]
MATSTMNQALELKQIAKDTFVNVHQPWLPHRARGIYGGVLIAQSLAAASRTVPKPELVQSMHCTFIVGGKPDVPLSYHVSRLQEDRHAHVRQVAAQQNGRVVFLAMVRFRAQTDRAVSGMVRIIKPIPRPEFPVADIMSGGNATPCPFVCTRIKRTSLGEAYKKSTTQWAKTRHALGHDAKPEAHAAALAYMTDNYFLCTVPRVHDLNDGIDPEEELDGPRPDDTRRRVQMMLSLDHSIYFHASPTAYCADDWLLMEMESPWAGDGRALVQQHVYSQSGLLLATCMQEGLIRMEKADIKL